MGRLTAKDKVHLAKLKLRGIAKLFYSAQPELKADDVTYAAFRTVFINRFKDKHTDQYHYTRVQTASQEKGESPEMFLDRLRKLCQRTIRTSENAVEQAVINQEADRRLLAAFINGLIGAPGKHVRLQMPENIDRALNMAVIATNAEKEERALGTVDRGNNARVFAVGGNHGDTPRNRYEKPRGKFQWSGTLGAVSQRNTGPVQYSRKVDGMYSDWTDCRTPTDAGYGHRRDPPTDVGYGHRGYFGEEAASGPKNDDNCWVPRRAYSIRCYSCGLMEYTCSSCPRGHTPTDAENGRRRNPPTDAENGRRWNLNGTGRTKTTLSSNLK